ncbi:MAG: GntR family transcriptional regulator [Bryobacteraceae bacterium]|jgi:DNA-binding GntR family transcriptional regulator
MIILLGERRLLQRVNRPPTLTAATAQNIQEAILRGDFAPGDPLREAELSESLEVSRGTVREALRLLHQEGALVEVISHRGAFVIKLSLERAREIYTLRALLEPYAIRTAMENRAYSNADLGEMEELVGRIERLEKEGNDSALVKADIEFHRLITRRSNHQLLLDMVNKLQSQALVLIFNTKLYRSDRVPDSLAHRAILEGLRAGDPAAAEEILRKHIIDAGSSLVKRMDEVQRAEGAPAPQPEQALSPAPVWPVGAAGTQAHAESVALGTEGISTSTG